MKDYIEQNIHNYRKLMGIKEKKGLIKKVKNHYINDLKLIINTR